MRAFMHTSSWLWLQVTCGGWRTLAVALHDAEAEDTEERRKGYKSKMKSWFSSATGSSGGSFGAALAPPMPSSSPSITHQNALGASPGRGALE